MAKRGTPDVEYDLLEQIGTGSFGTVHRAVHKSTHNVVAIKVMKRTSESAESTNAREYKTLKHLARHPNIVQLYDSFIGPQKDFYFIMEYMDQGNLYQLIKLRREANQALDHAEIRSFLRQVLKALAHLHQQGIFHRDMKPENLLIRSGDTNHSGAPINHHPRMIIKLADFGLARELKSRPPYTDYVSTRWYRAPEVLLRSSQYSYPVDLWAVGAIFAELITLRPLFPGQSEIDQLYRICQILGSPSRPPPSSSSSPPRRHQRGRSNSGKKSDPDARLAPILPPVVIPAGTVDQQHPDPSREWAEGVKLAHKIGFNFVEMPPKPLDTMLPTASVPMLDLLRRFLVFDPAKRIRAHEALRSDFIVEEDDKEACPEKDFEIPAILQPSRKSLLWQKSLGNSLMMMASAQNTNSNNNSRLPQLLPQELKEALRLSKSKTIDRLHRKKSTLFVDSNTHPTIQKSNSVNDFSSSNNSSGSVAAAAVGDENKKPFDLPAIPALSPIFTDWGHQATRALQQHQPTVAAAAAAAATTSILPQRMV